MIENNAFLTTVSSLSECDYESVIQSLITNCNQVWVNELAFDKNQEKMVDKLFELREAGLIKVWNYEILLNNRSSKIDKVISNEEHNEANSYVDQILLQGEEQSLKNDTQYTTFRIEKRNMLTNLVTAKFCGADSIIQRDSKPISVQSGKQNLFQLYAQQLFNETCIDSVSGLSVDDIMKLRKYSSAFRKKINGIINERLINGEVPPSVIREDCKKLSAEYCNEINERIKSSMSVVGVVKGVALDILSLLLSPISLIGAASKIGDFALNHEKRGVIMYLTTLKTARRDNN